MNPTGMQCIHPLDLMGSMTPGKLAESTGLGVPEKNQFH